jgi:hypothetical protein
MSIHNTARLTDMWEHICNPRSWRLRQENQEFETSLGYLGNTISTNKNSLSNLIFKMLVSHIFLLCISLNTEKAVEDNVCIGIIRINNTLIACKTNHSKIP